MPTRRFAATISPLSPAARLGAALVLSLAACTAAEATDISGTSCIGTWRGYNCVSTMGPATDPYVRLVPPLNESDQSRMVAHDRKWQAHCHPIVEPDRYGVPRYRYSARGCEFGVGED